MADSTRIAMLSAAVLIALTGLLQGAQASSRPSTGLADRALEEVLLGRLDEGEANRALRYLARLHPDQGTRAWAGAEVAPEAAVGSVAAIAKTPGIDVRTPSWSLPALEAAPPSPVPEEPPTSDGVWEPPESSDAGWTPMSTSAAVDMDPTPVAPTVVRTPNGPTPAPVQADPVNLDRSDSAPVDPAPVDAAPVVGEVAGPLRADTGPVATETSEPLLDDDDAVDAGPDTDVDEVADVAPPEHLPDAADVAAEPDDAVADADVAPPELLDTVAEGDDAVAIADVEPPAPPPTPIPVVDFASIDLSDDFLSGPDVVLALAVVEDDVASCWADALAEQPGLGGIVELRFSVSGGHAALVRAERDDVGSASFTACVNRLVLRGAYGVDARGEVTWRLSVSDAAR